MKGVASNRFAHGSGEISNPRAASLQLADSSSTPAIVRETF
jgi:hypothetical protein